MAFNTYGRVLVAGVGNIFLGDDAFGVEVVKLLAREALPERAKVVDFGTRSLDLVYELVGGTYESLILVDTVSRGGSPGTLYVLLPEELQYGTPFVDPHGLRPHQIAGMVRQLGGEPCPTLVVGCEPARLYGEPGLSPAVTASLGEAVRLVRALALQPATASTMEPR